AWQQYARNMRIDPDDLLVCMNVRFNVVMEGIKNDSADDGISLFANELFYCAERCKRQEKRQTKAAPEAPLLVSHWCERQGYAKLSDWREDFMRRLPTKPSRPRPASIM